MSYDLSIGGGMDDVNYYVLVGYFNIEGIVII